VERFVERHALKNVRNVSKKCAHAFQWNRSHSDTCQRTLNFYARTKYSIAIAGHAEFVGAHVSECFHTGHMCANKSLDASNDLHLSVKVTL